MNDNYIKIYSSFQVKIDGEIKDILYLDAVDLARKIDDKYYILRGKYRGVYIDPLSSNLQDGKIVAKEITVWERNEMCRLGTDGSSAKSLKELLQIRAKLKDYYTISVNEETKEVSLIPIGNCQIETVEREIDKIKRLYR